MLVDLGKRKGGGKMLILLASCTPAHMGCYILGDVTYLLWLCCFPPSCMYVLGDRFRVILKGETPDFIHAVFAHVSGLASYTCNTFINMTRQQ